MHVFVLRTLIPRRLSESLATVRALTEAERGGEAADVARIRAKGKEARKQTQAVSALVLIVISSIYIVVVIITTISYNVLLFFYPTMCMQYELIS